jgi:DNA-binding NarL/FixJ family response regulator
LHSGLDAAEAGRPPVVVLHGEAGVGKTRIATQFADQARDRGALTLSGTCWEDGGALPYCPWGEAVDRHVEGLDGDRLTELLGADAPILAGLTPRIATSLGNGSPSTPPSESVQRVAEAVAHFLDSAGKPIVVFLDDLHWATSESLAIFAHVAHSAANAMLVAIYQGRELDISHPLASCLGEVNRNRPTEYIRLTGLLQREATALLVDAAQAPVDRRTAEAVHRASGGNPFFVGELGRYLLAKGSVPGVAAWHPPEPVRQAVALRLAHISDPARDLLEHASLLKGGFAFEELGLLSDLDEDMLLTCLEEALAQEVIRPVGGVRYEFAPPIVGYTIYAQFSPSRRARIHRRLAEGLERVYEGRTADVAAELARQYHGSATLPGAARGVEHALAAVEQARTGNAPVDAVEFARMAIDLAPRDDAPMQARVMGQLALAQAEAGMVEEALRSLEAAFPFLEEAGASAEAIATLVHDVVSRLNVAYPRQEALGRVITRGLGVLGETHDLTWARLKLLQRPREKGASGAVANGWDGFDPEAVAIARAEGSADDYARSIDWYTTMSASDLAELVPRVEAAREPAVRLRALIGITHHLMLTDGVTPTVERLGIELEALAQELGSPHAIALAATQRAAILAERGEFEQAATAIAEARSLAESLGPESQVEVAAILIGELAAQHVAPDWGRIAEEMGRLSASKKPVLWGTVCSSYVAYALTRAGMANEGAELLAELVPALARRAPTDHEQSGAVGLAGAAVWELGSVELAEDLLPCALALIDAGVADWYMTSNELSVARMAAVLNRSDQAEEYFERARDKLSARGQRPLCAIVDFDEAIARRARRQAGAARLLASAEAQLDALGMAAWSRRIAHEDLAAELPDELTPREAEVLRLVATGSTNNEIAAALFLSVHTVERHLTNSYRKMDVRNRVDATAYVMRTDL